MNFPSMPLLEATLGLAGAGITNHPSDSPHHLQGIVVTVGTPGSGQDWGRIENPKNQPSRAESTTLLRVSSLTHLLCVRNWVSTGDTPMKEMRHIPARSPGGSQMKTHCSLIRTMLGDSCKVREGILEEAAPTESPGNVPSSPGHEGKAACAG